MQQLLPDEVVSGAQSDQPNPVVLWADGELSRDDAGRHPRYCLAKPTGDRPQHILSEVCVPFQVWGAGAESPMTLGGLVKISSPRHHKSCRVRRLFLFVAVVAALAMSVVTVAVSSAGSAPNGNGHHAVVVATKGPSASTITAPVARPDLVSPAWQGKGWPGPGPYRGNGPYRVKGRPGR